MKRAKIGQHFLVNRGIAEKITQTFLPVDGPILEIGPGKGILTRCLVDQCKINKISAVELDRTLFNQLKETFSQNLELLNLDILLIDLFKLFPGEDEAVNIIGNVPYYISKELMDWVIVHYKKISKGLFMMQREFVNKFISPSNAQSLVFSLLFRVGKRFEVHPGSFSPRPLVNSTVFLFERTFSPFENDIDVRAFYIFLRQCFRNRRKTLFNNLAATFGTKTSTDIFAKLNIPAKIRAEQLTLEDFLEVFQSFSSSVIKIC